MFPVLSQDSRTTHHYTKTKLSKATTKLDETIQRQTQKKASHQQILAESAPISAN